MLTLVIVSFNSFSTVKLCLDTLLRSAQYEVIIVDNASTDDSVIQYKAAYPEVNVIELKQNIGYGRAANRAFEQVKTQFAFLLNPDMKASVESVSELEERMSALGDNAAILAPAVREKDFNESGLIEKNRVVGAAMLFNMSVMSKVGFFDENIFLFSEETELCYRVKQAGLNIFLDSDNYMEHLAKQSSRPSVAVDYLKSWHFGWSRIYFYEKYGLNTGKKRAWRILLRYAYKLLTARNAAKRLAYRARLLGTFAYVRGQKAFLEDGTAQNAWRLKSG